jgi:hypothetical protein
MSISNPPDMLWQYKRECAKKLANKSGASKVVNQMFEFDHGINKITDWVTPLCKPFVTK